MKSGDFAGIFQVSLIIEHGLCTGLLACIDSGIGDHDQPAMSLISDEIRDQPHAWKRACALARDSRAALPAGERIAVIGCGSSWHAAKALAALRERSGAG